MAVTKYDFPLCSSGCGSKTRRMYAPPKGTKGRQQHSRWFVCERGHKIVRKRGQ